jgi:SAM-dependent methyltransferase
MRMAGPYQRLAGVYDDIGADHHSVEMVEYTFKIFRKFKIRPTTLLDCCCGTGTALELFADHGLQVAGLDRSAEMLARAAAKLKGRKVKLYHKELPKFRVLASRKGDTRTFDVVTSFYDSLNYMKNRAELTTAFKSINEHINDKGWFIFDMNTPEALKYLWGGAVYADAREDIAWIWKNSYDPKTKSAECITTCFTKKGSSWERFDESHVERGYSNTDIRKMLREAGFVVRGLYRCKTFEPPRGKVYRIGVVAQKK